MIQYDNQHGLVNNAIAFTCGIVGGLIDLMIRFNPLSIFGIIQAGITALICGAAGVAGKELYSQFAKPFLKKILKKFKKRKV